MAVQKKYTASRPFRDKPSELLAARETIRKHFPALALRLDVNFPLEPCDHDWPKAQQISRGPIYSPPEYICRGCGERVFPHGSRTNTWLTQSEHDEYNKRFREAIKRMQAEQQSPIKIKPRPRRVVR